MKNEAELANRPQTENQPPESKGASAFACIEDLYKRSQVECCTRKNNQKVTNPCRYRKVVEVGDSQHDARPSVRFSAKVALTVEVAVRKVAEFEDSGKLVAARKACLNN